MSPHISAADIEAITAQIASRTAPVDCATFTRANGEPWRDAAREYFCQLPGEGSWRVARVTAYREPWGHWRLGDVDVFNLATASVVDGGDDAAREILAAIEEAQPART